ncbi:MAG: hypothetical protein ACYC3X_09235 [Pirellulaceae bacterium]
MYGLPTAAPVEYSADDLSFDGVAIVLDDYQVDEVVVRREAVVDKSPVHYRPAQIGRLADTIPFYWQGEYHIFYLVRTASGTPTCGSGTSVIRS